MNIRSLLSLILLCATTFDATLFAAKRSFDDVDYSEFYEDDEFCDDDEQEDDKDTKSKPSSSKDVKKITNAKPAANHLQIKAIAISTNKPILEKDLTNANTAQKHLQLMATVRNMNEPILEKDLTNANTAQKHLHK